MFRIRINANEMKSCDWISALEVLINSRDFYKARFFRRETTLAYLDGSKYMTLFIKGINRNENIEILNHDINSMSFKRTSIGYLLMKMKLKMDEWAYEFRMCRMNHWFEVGCLNVQNKSHKKLCIFKFNFSNKNYKKWKFTKFSKIISEFWNFMP